MRGGNYGTRVKVIYRGRKAVKGSSLLQLRLSVGHWRVGPRVRRLRCLRCLRLRCLEPRGEIDEALGTREARGRVAVAVGPQVRAAQPDLR